MKELPVRVKIADRTYSLRVEPDAEAIVREAAKLIQEQLKQYRESGFSDTQELLAMVAFDCLVSKLKGDQQMKRLLDKMTQLDQVVTSVITT